MTLSRRVLWLWYIRLGLGFAALFVLEIIAVGYIGKIPPAACISVLALSAILLCAAAYLLYLRYRQCRIFFYSDKLLFCAGILIKKQTYIHYSSICSLKTSISPAQRLLRLCTIVMYCEGATFFMPGDCAMAQRLESLAAQV